VTRGRPASTIDPTAIEIRPLETLAELKACVALQEETWGEGFSERVPVSLLKVSARLGGVVSGAFGPDGDSLLGFVFGITGWVERRPVHWSDMLAVAPAARGLGLGRRLKLHQRERVVALGVERMHWTFDPLVARNAHLNLNRLGAVVREYAEDFYGASNSPLHGALGTDRFVATWDLTTARVLSRLGGAPPASPGVSGHRAVMAIESDVATGVAIPGEPLVDVVSGAPVRVPIPSDIDALRDRDPASAATWRRATRAALTRWIGEGYVVKTIGAEPSPDPPAVLWYLLDPSDEDSHE
jgi:predicted GNAT superfamily acetyltransferase